MHKRNKHKTGYNFDRLIKAVPELKNHVKPGRHQNLTIDFSDPLALKLLNKALLFVHYNLSFWDIPEGYLCPGVPGRADYIHHIADFLDANKKSYKPYRIIDIGTGANCIYPLIAYSEYGWSVTASESDEEALASAQQIIEKNKLSSITIRFQKKKSHIFKNIIKNNESYDISICNPPFYTSLEEAYAHTERKNKNLKKNFSTPQKKNFSGRTNELIYDGGGKRFLELMIDQSQHFKDQCRWFSCLLNNQKRFKSLKHTLKKVGAQSVQLLPMSLGQKKSHIIIWTF